MQWYVLRCDKEAAAAAAQEETYVFPKKYHNYKDIIREYIGEIKRLEEFLLKGTEKLLPKKSGAAKKKSMSKSATK